MEITISPKNKKCVLQEETFVDGEYGELTRTTLWREGEITTEVEEGFDFSIFESDDSHSFSLYEVISHSFSDGDIIEEKCEAYDDDWDDEAFKERVRNGNVDTDENEVILTGPLNVEFQ